MSNESLPESALSQSELPESAMSKSELPESALSQSELPESALSQSEQPKSALSQSELPESALSQSELPKDRSHVETEKRNPSSVGLHKMSVRECLQTFLQADHDVLAAMEAVQPSLAEFLESAKLGFAQGGRLVYFGAGTSGRLAVLDASEAPPTFQVEPDRVVGIIAGGDGSLRKSSEGKEDEWLGAVEALAELQLTAIDTVVGIAAGGTTPYVRGGLQWLAERDSPPLTALMCCADVDLPVGVDHRLYLPTGPEVLTGSTRMKAGTATKLCLNAISTTLMIQDGRVYDNLMVDVRASNEKLRDRAARILMHLTNLSREQAFAALHSANGELKVALVMDAHGLDYSSAKSLLERRGLVACLDGQPEE